MLTWIAGYLLVGLIVNLCLFGPIWKSKISPSLKETLTPVTFGAGHVSKKRLTGSAQGRAALGIRKRLARQTC